MQPLAGVSQQDIEAEVVFANRFTFAGLDQDEFLSDYDYEVEEEPLITPVLLIGDNNPFSLV